MKPSERIKQIAASIAGEMLPKYVRPSAKELDVALPYAIARYLDEQAERREHSQVVATTASGAEVHGLRRYEPEPEATEE